MLFFFIFVFCLSLGKNITYCFTVIVRLTPSIHVCVRRSIQPRGGRSVLFLCRARFPLTGQTSDRPGRLSSTALTYTLQRGGCSGSGGGMRTNELREPWHFFLWRILHGKRDSNLPSPCVSAGQREGNMQGETEEAESRMFPSRILTARLPPLRLAGHFSSRGLVCACVCVCALVWLRPAL